MKAGSFFTRLEKIAVVCKNCSVERIFREVTLTHISLNYCAIVIISDYLKEEEEFEKVIMAIVQSSVPEKVTLQQLLEETHSHPDLPAIARGYFTTKEKKECLAPSVTPFYGVGCRGRASALRHKVAKLALKVDQGVSKTKDYLSTRV